MPTTTVENKVTDLETARTKLAQMRDELKLEIHLAKADLRDEWGKLEKKWNRFDGKLRGLQRDSEETAEEMWEDVRGLARDLKEGYDRIRRSL